MKSHKRVKFPIAFQFTLGFSVLILLSTILMGIFTYHQMIRQYIEPLIGKRLDFTARGIAVQISGDRHEQIFNLLLKNPKQFSSSQPVADLHRILILAQRQNELSQEIHTYAKDPRSSDRMILVLNSGEDLTGGQTLPMDPWVAQVLKEGLPLFTPIFEREGGHWMSGITTIETAKGDAVAALRVDYPVDQEMKQVQLEIVMTLMIASLIAFALATALGVVIGRNLSKPIQTLVDATLEVSSGNLEPQYVIRSQNEIGILADGFKQMLEEIRLSRNSQMNYSKMLEDQVTERTQSIQRLLRVVIHDVASPLSVIRLTASQAVEVLDEECDPDLQKKLWTKVLSASGSIEAIIRNTREIEAVRGGAKSIELVPVCLTSVISALKTLFEDRLKMKAIAFRVHDPSSLLLDLKEGVKVLANETLLIHSILGNLISNSIKFSPVGADLDFSISVEMSQGKKQIQMVLRDYGVGMPLDMVSALMEGRQLKSTPGTQGEKGTGFGLALAKVYTEAMGGVFHLRSERMEEGAGTSGTEISIFLSRAEA